MAAITGDFAIGAYDVTFNGNSIGLVEGAIKVQSQFIGAPIRASKYGQSIIDVIIQGGAEFVAIVLKEWNANTKAAMWQAGSGLGRVYEAGKLIGAGSLAKSLVLTAVANTPAATEGPATRTYPLAFLLPGHTLDAPFYADERNIPLVFAVLPEIDSGSTLKFFTDT